jgi:AcrR family transcriptional regulator
VIDEAVVDQALDLLSRDGYGALTVSTVAAAAGTTRQAVYRRWPERTDLARAAVDRLAATGGGPAGPPGAAAYDELVAELAGLQRELGTSTGAGLAGAVLLLDVPAELRSRYRQRVCGPRQRRLRRLLDGAVADGHLAREADVDLVVLSLIGSLLAASLTGNPPGRRWPERAAAMAWRSLGGTPPRPAGTRRGR